MEEVVKRARLTVVAAFVGVTAFILPSRTPAAGTPQQVRLSWQEFSRDPARVASFARGIEIMKSRNAAAPTSAEYRMSWEYWASIHSYYGRESSNGTVADGLAGLQRAGLGQLASRFTGITDLLPPDALAREVWDGCRHSWVENGQLNAQNFLGWHRIYLYYFERVLRAAAQDETLRLPYWDYTNPAQVKLPAGFGLINGQPANTALFEARRAPGLNTGTQVISATATNIDSVLGNDTFEGLSGFSFSLERGVHGTIHCMVGSGCPAPYMGAVAVSANDPVFWLHHTNLDRLFECWMTTHHKKPTGTFATDSFPFVDETGVRVERTVSDFLDANALDYRYDNVAACTRAAAGPELTLNAPPQPAEPKSLTLAQAKRVSLGKSVVKVALPIRAAGAGPSGAPATVTNTEALELVLGDVAFDKAPGAMFNIYLGRPGAPPAERVYVGTLNFFGAGEGRHGKHAITQVFDVTTQAKSIVARTAAAAAKLEVTFEATAGLDPAPGVAAGPPPTMTLGQTTTIGSVELRARPRQEQ
jgi:hypothetical protein